MIIDVKEYSKPCSCGKEHAIDVKEIYVESGAVRRLAAALEDGVLCGCKKPTILCDNNTRAAAEPYMEDIFARCGVLELDSTGLHADNHGVALVEAGLPADTDLIIAVGSGTVHDLSRYVAFHRGISFVSVPTAASVDGFVSTVAAMTWDGLKVTLPAAAPLIVYADSDIFSKAPLRLNASGVGDLMGKYVCLADWNISRIVTGEYYCEEIVNLEKKALETVRACLGGISAGEKEPCEQLMYALLLSGLAMQMVGNSRPASGAEHHMSHFWEMEVLNDTIDALHGEKVAVGTVLMLDRYHNLAKDIRSGKVHAHPYSDEDWKKAIPVFEKKGILEGIIKENDPELLLSVDTERLEASLPAIADILEELPEAEEMASLLEASTCPKAVTDFGLSEDIIPESIRLSPYVRRRLTLNRMMKLLG